MLGLLPLSVKTFVRLLTHEPKSLIGGTLMRTVIATLSVINILAGAGLAVLFFVDSSPSVVAVLSAALMVQGIFTVAVLVGAVGRHPEVTRHIQLAGSTLAFVVGSVGILTGMATNLAANNTDPEYGPTTIAMLLAMHGLFSLVAFGSSHGDAATFQTTP